MKYYKAEVHYMTELYVNNNVNEGCNPDTTQDCGMCDTMTASTKEKLKKDLVDRFGEIEHFEDNRYETGYDELERDGTNVYVMVSIYISEVKESEATL